MSMCAFNIICMIESSLSICLSTCFDVMVRSSVYVFFTGVCGAGISDMYNVD